MAIYTDIPNDFSVNSVTKDLNLKENLAAIRQSIVNLLTYDYSDKPFHPEIIFNLKRVLFEPLDNITKAVIVNNLKNMLTKYEPRVYIIEVTIETKDDQKIAVNVYFSLPDVSDEVFTVTHYFYRTR